MVFLHEKNEKKIEEGIELTYTEEMTMNGVAFFTGVIAIFCFVTVVR